MKKILFGIGTLAVILVAGCSDFLDREPYGQTPTWTSEDDVTKAIAALYYFTSQEGTSGRGFMWFECCSDNVIPGRARPSADAIREFQMPENNSDDQKDNWKLMYENVAKANNLIKVVPTLAVGDAFKRESVGIGYFFRGFSMLWLAPWYGDNGTNGGIPIILDTTEPAAMDAPRPASVLMNYDQIISDMRTAGDMLPLFSELPAKNYGYPHKAAAWAFAARAALYAAQYDQNYYNIVIEMCDKIMALSGADKRELFDDGTPNAYANYWRKAQNFGSEYLFSMLGNAIEGPKFHGISFNKDGYNIINTWGYYQPTLELYNAFENGDTRRDATILRPGQRISFVGNDILFGGKSRNNKIGKDDFLWSISSTSGMTFRKFLSPYEAANCLGTDVNTNGNNMTTTLGICLIRFADVLLMKAEALIWLNGEGDGEAKQLLNRIRKRARLPENSLATKAQLKNERRCELAFEYQPSRHLDMIRWGDAETAYKLPTYGITSTWDDANKVVVINPTPVLLYGPRTFNPKVHHVFPIPPSAFDGSVNLKQNKGYN